MYTCSNSPVAMAFVANHIANKNLPHRQRDLLSQIILGCIIRQWYIQLNPNKGWIHTEHDPFVQAAILPVRCSEWCNSVHVRRSTKALRVWFWRLWEVIIICDLIGHAQDLGMVTVVYHSMAKPFLSAQKCNFWHYKVFWYADSFSRCD